MFERQSFRFENPRVHCRLRRVTWTKRGKGRTLRLGNALAACEVSRFHCALRIEDMIIRPTASGNKGLSPVFSPDTALRCRRSWPGKEETPIRPEACFCTLRIGLVALTQSRARHTVPQQVDGEKSGLARTSHQTRIRASAARSGEPFHPAGPRSPGGPGPPIRRPVVARPGRRRPAYRNPARSGARSA